MNPGLIKVYSNLALLTTAMISGLSFVAQKAGMEFVGPLTFNTLRAFLGSLVLLPVIVYFKVKTLRVDNRSDSEKLQQRKTLIKGGVICGVLLFLALTINQYCMLFAPAGKAGFITSLYIIFVPLISVFLKKRLRINVKISVFLALIGLYFLCYKSSSGIELSDLFLLISSIFFAFHIIVVGYYSHKMSSIKLAFIQFLTVGIISMPLMFLLEPLEPPILLEGYKPILFSGIVVTGVAYTLQIYGQKHTPPVIVSLILSSEALFALLGGIIYFDEVLRPVEIVGCVFMISAIILSQLKLPLRFYKK